MTEPVLMYARKLPGGEVFLGELRSEELPEELPPFDEPPHGYVVPVYVVPKEQFEAMQAALRACEENLRLTQEGKSNPHIGSSLDSLLDEMGVLEEIEETLKKERGER